MAFTDYRGGSMPVRSIRNGVDPPGDDGDDGDDIDDGRRGRAVRPPVGLWRPWGALGAIEAIYVARAVGTGWRRWGPPASSMERREAYAAPTVLRGATLDR